MQASIVVPKYVHCVGRPPKEASNLPRTRSTIDDVTYADEQVVRAERNRIEQLAKLVITSVDVAHDDGPVAG